MKEYLLAERYARALGEAMPDTGRLETAHAQLASLAEMADTHHELRSCLGNHAIAMRLRAQVLDQVMRGQGAEPEVMRLATLLLKRGRIFLLGDIAEILTRIVDERRGRVSVTVTSASALTPEQEASIREGLATYSGKCVRMTSEVDPDLLGGVVARIGGQVIDGSLRFQLDQLRDELIAEEI